MKIIIPNISSALLCSRFFAKQPKQTPWYWCWYLLLPHSCQNNNKNTTLQLHFSNRNWWIGELSIINFFFQTKPWNSQMRNIAIDNWIWILVKTLSLISHKIFWNLLHFTSLLPDLILIVRFFSWINIFFPTSQGAPCKRQTCLQHLRVQTNDTKVWESTIKDPLDSKTSNSSCHMEQWGAVCDQMLL